MANPNKDLCVWLFEVIDGSWSNAESRFSSKTPYEDKDLVRIGKDSVKVTRVDTGKNLYSLEFAPLGSYFDFADGNITSFPKEDEQDE
jgi:hypothetical protein